MKKTDLILRFFVKMSLIVALITTLNSCSTNETDGIFYIGGTTWTAAWYENDYKVECTLTFAETICVLEIFRQYEKYYEVCDYLHEGNLLIVNYDGMYKLTLNGNTIIWDDFPFSYNYNDRRIVFYRQTR